MDKFDLTSTLEPTDEQLQALMDGIGEIGRQSMERVKAAFERMLIEALV